MQTKHNKYSRTLGEVTNYQTEEKKQLRTLFARCKKLQEVLRRLRHDDEKLSAAEKSRLDDLNTDLQDCKSHLVDIEGELPRDSNGYV